MRYMLCISGRLNVLNMIEQLFKTVYLLSLLNLDRTETRRMGIFSFPFLLLLLFTTATLLFGEEQAAYLQELENQGIFQEDSPIGRDVQYYKPLHSHQLKENKFFENHNHCKSEEACQDEYKIIDCCRVKTLFPKASSGVFTINIGGPSKPSGSLGYTFPFRCDMETDGGGWTVIQRRVPGGAVNFTRNWEDYETGFGNLNEEFWFGLRNLHCLTTQREVELRIDMVPKRTNTKMSWTYQVFRVAGAEDKYKLFIGGGQGEGTDAMGYHHNQLFSTYDEDNDGLVHGNCAYIYQGGWWYRHCYNANLNGPHNTPSLPGVNQNKAKIMWFDAYLLELRSVKMMIRDKECYI